MPYLGSNIVIRVEARIQHPKFKCSGLSARATCVTPVTLWFVSKSILSLYLFHERRVPLFLFRLQLLTHWSRRTGFLFFAFIFYLFNFRQWGRDGERGRETLMCKRYINRLPLARPQLGTWSTTQACALTGNRTGELLVVRPALNPLSTPARAEQSF